MVVAPWAGQPHRHLAIPHPASPPLQLVGAPAHPLSYLPLDHHLEAVASAHEVAYDAKAPFACLKNGMFGFFFSRNNVFLSQ